MKKMYTLTLGRKLLLSFSLFLSFVVMGNAQFQLVMGSSPVTCEVGSDGTAYVESHTGVEPLTYLWNDGQDFVVANNLMLGTYTVTATDATGATAEGTVDVVLSPESVWLMPMVTNAACGCNGMIDPMASLGLPPYSYEWSDGQTGAIATDLCAGTYTVTVTDSQGCASTATATVGEDTEGCGFQLVMGASPATCEVATDGTAYVESHTGVEPATYLWSDGQTFVVAENLMIGTYTVTVTDATGATAVGSVDVELSPESVWLMPVVTNENCGDCTGTIDPMASLGLPPYSYEWSDGQTGAIATDLCAGTYTVTVTDSQGCASTATATVGDDCTECNVEAGTASTEDETLFCVGDGTPDVVLVNIDGATTGANSEWVIADEDGLILATPPGPTFNFEMGVAGSAVIYYVVYTGTVTGLEIDGNINNLDGCFDITNGISVVRLEQPTPATLDPEGTVEVCVGDGEDDFVDATATGATGENMAWIITDENGDILALPAELPFNFEEAPAGTCLIYHATWNGDLTGLEQGANVSDLEGCHALSEAITVERNTLEASIVVDSEISECKAADGALSVVGAGTAATYEWSNGETTASIDGLNEDTYTVTVTEGACVEVLTMAIYDNAIDIGDYVWYDNNENCRQDSYERGVPFVPVYLYGVGADGLACTADDELLETTGTDADGYYLFECVLEGSYYVQFHATSIEPDYEYTCKDGANDAMDSDANPDGKTDAFDVVDLTTDILTIDAGINPICNDVNYGGRICCDQTICAGEAPATITSQAPAGGGGTNDIEYLWMCAYTPSNPGNPSTWTVIPNSNSAELNPGSVYRTKYFVRCARRAGCDSYNAESNTVTIRVVSCMQMISFDAVADAQQAVNLTWSVESDSDTNNYEVERSADGQTFELIRTLKGKTSLDGTMTYLTRDEQPNEGTNIYRIKQIDEFGNVSYSTLREVEFEGAAQKFAVYPNPTTNILRVENNSLFDAPVMVDFMTIQGQVLQTLAFPAEAFTQQKIDLTGLAAGTYFVRITYTDQDVEMLKVSKL